MSAYIDQLQRQILLNDIPERIVSLVPSITELLFDLALEEEVVGITKFCVHPAKWFGTKTRVGGTKNVRLDVIASLHPQLIIANKEENVQEQIEQLEKIAPVWVSDIHNLEDALDMIEKVGVITGQFRKSKEVIEKIQASFQLLASPLQERKSMGTCYLIWRKPYMSIGGDTFINDMMQRCGFENVFADKMRYPEVSPGEIRATGCEMVFLSSEPYPFKQRHVVELQNLLPGCDIRLVDGEMFSWYGSRLILAAGYFQNLVNQIAFRNKKL